MKHTWSAAMTAAAAVICLCAALPVSAAEHSGTTRTTPGPTETSAQKLPANDTADPSSITLIAAMLSVSALLGFATYRKD